MKTEWLLFLAGLGLGYLFAWSYWSHRFHAINDEILRRWKVEADALSVREAEPDPNQLEVPFKNDRGAW